MSIRMAQDSDTLSISSDFSIIPESMLCQDDFVAEDPAGLTTSFLRGEIIDASRVSSSPFNKVKFESIEVSSPSPNCNLEVTYKISPDLSPKSSDRMGLFKVGFTSPQDYLCYKWAPTFAEPNGDMSVPNIFKVVFDGAILPKDDKEFYQFSYLTHEGNIAGVSDPFQMSQFQKNVFKEEMLELQEKLALKSEELLTCNGRMQIMKNQLDQLLDDRKDLENRVKDLVVMKGTLEMELKESQKRNNIATEKIRELEEIAQHIIQSVEKELKLQERLAGSQNTVNDLEDKVIQMGIELEEKQHLEGELMKRDQVLQEKCKIIEELEESIIQITLEMCSYKDRLDQAESQSSITEERHSVVLQDNDKLKETLAQLKATVLQQQNTMDLMKREKESVERIASNFSQRLQDARKEYQDMAITNLKLTKKVKKMRKVLVSSDAQRGFSMVSSVTSQPNESWLCVDDNDETDDKEVSEDNSSIDGKDDLPSVITRSCVSVDGANSSCSTCSQTTNQLTDAMNLKMEEIVKKLSDQIHSLKIEIAETKKVQKESSLVSQQAESMTQINADVSAEAPSSFTSIGAVSDKIIYENSFLPAQRTAPVFLPSISSDCPLPQVLPSGSVPLNTVFSDLPETPARTSIAANDATPTLSSVTPTEVVNTEGLPPPLTPEATQVARNAAIMRQFAEHLDGNVNSMPSAPSREVVIENHESDEEDFHSTGEAEQTNSDQVNYEDMLNSRAIKCPMCPLSFIPGTLKKLEEHINEHLDYICPMCPVSFSRIADGSFVLYERHVKSHFSDEEDEDDSSGPWARSTRGLHLLEID